jgi:hypothetical protein
LRRLSRVASVWVSRLDLPAWQRGGGLLWLTEHLLGLRRRGSLDRGHLGDPLRRRRIIIVEQRHDIDLAFRSPRRSWRRRLRLS